MPVQTRRVVSCLSPGVLLACLFCATALGLLAFASFQASREEGSAPGTDTRKYEFYAIGPEINWRPQSVPGFRAAVRVGFEFDSRNTSQGTGAIFSLAYGF